MKKIITLMGIVFATLTINAQTMEKEYFNYLQTPNPKRIQPFEWRMFPRPQSVKKTHNKVIVVFDRKEWEAFHYMHRKMWMRRGEVHKQLNELKKK